MLATDDEPSGARVIRLMLKNVSSKQSNNRPSPAKAKGNPNWRRNADDSDDDGESDAPDDAEEEVKSDESDGMSYEERSWLENEVGSRARHCCFVASKARAR